jgi:hypothetical protein
MKTPVLVKSWLRLSVYVLIVFVATSSLLFGAQGIRLATNFLGSGLDFIDQYSTS